MRAQCSIFIATSVDGFIARTDGSIDWLIEANASVPPGEDCGYKEFMSTLSAIVIGRNTFEQVLSFGGWAYETTPVVVMARREITLPAHLPDTVTVSQESPCDLVDRLSQNGAKRLYIDGGLTIQSFLAAGLIDDLTQTLIPILYGSGKPLFGLLPSDVRLIHEATRAFDFGFVQNRYRVAHIA